MDESLKRAIKAASVAAVARACQVTPQAVSQWRVAPANQVLAVSRAVNFGVTPHELRPDLYPHPDDGLPQELRGRATA